MKRTQMKLNLMPANRKQPSGLDDGELVILTNPSRSIISDTINAAADIDWAGRSIVMNVDGKVESVEVTHYIVLTS